MMELNKQRFDRYMQEHLHANVLAVADEAPKRDFKLFHLDVPVLKNEPDDTCLEAYYAYHNAHDAERTRHMLREINKLGENALIVIGTTHGRGFWKG